MRDFDRDDNSDQDDYFRFTGKARLSRDMHILEGLVQGITADSKVRDVELRSLTTWLTAHKEFSDRHPFNEIIPKIQRIITNGIVDEEERADILWLSNKFSTENEYYDEVTSEMQRLQGILAGILADGLINEKELQTLGMWVEERSFLRRCWPYDDLEGIIDHVMRDGRIDAQEHEALLQFFGEFVSSEERKAVGVVERDVTVSGVCSMSPAIEVLEHCFCFTGTSKRCSKKELASIVNQLGGQFHENLRSDTDFLIVGANGNPCWAFACYGRKVEDAMNRRRTGQQLTIAHEFDFWQVVDGAPIRHEQQNVVEVKRKPKNRVESAPKKRRRANAIDVSQTDVRHSLAGKTFVVTGTLQKYKREEIESLIVQHGGHAASSVSKKTDYLIAGEKAGSKLDKARTLGVRVISEAEFDKLISS